MNHAQMTEVARALRLLGEHGETLTTDTPLDKIEEIRKDLARATRLLEETSGPAPTTDCAEHPYGAVDLEAPDRCLFCQSRRSRAGQVKAVPAVQEGAVPRGRRAQCPSCLRPLARGTVDTVCRDCREGEAADRQR